MGSVAATGAALSAPLGLVHERRGRRPFYAAKLYMSLRQAEVWQNHKRGQQLLSRPAHAAARCTAVQPAYEHCQAAHGDVPTEPGQQPALLRLKSVLAALAVAAALMVTPLVAAPAWSADAAKVRQVSHLPSLAQRCVVVLVVHSMKASRLRCAKIYSKTCSLVPYSQSLLTESLLSVCLIVCSLLRGQVGTCLLESCQAQLAGCLADLQCVENLVCLNKCNGRPDESECQVRFDVIHIRQSPPQLATLLNKLSIERHVPLADEAELDVSAHYPMLIFGGIGDCGATKLRRCWL